ncbi:MAG: mechanosensitive ion channel family protein [Candidatus Omnitrophica bacterium]|nr:mechanosensitive ion channel family protein [Candidatus Omnitrophota bacterium]
MPEEILAMLQKASDTVVEFLIKYGFQVLGGILILIIGMKLAQWLSRAIVRICEKNNMDVTLTKFMGGVVKILVMVFVILVALEKFGITIAPLIAAATALAFGGSFAIQGPLSNYAAGLSIILAKPFIVGDTITLLGVSGVVEDVKLSSTVLSTEDGEKITIPNKHIVGEIIHNSKGNKVVETVVGISYSDDPQKAIEAIRKVLGQFSQIAAQPAPHLGLKEFGDSSLNIEMRYWVPTRQYYPTLYAVNLAVHQALKQAGISIPFPQRDLHIISQTNGASLQRTP